MNPDFPLDTTENVMKTGRRRHERGRVEPRGRSRPPIAAIFKKSSVVLGVRKK